MELEVGLNLSPTFLLRNTTGEDKRIPLLPKADLYPQVGFLDTAGVGRVDGLGTTDSPPFEGGVDAPSKKKTRRFLIKGAAGVVVSSNRLSTMDNHPVCAQLRWLRDIS